MNKFYQKIWVVLACMTLMAAAPACANTYQISPEDSLVDFQLTHTIGFTTGWILVSKGTIDASADEIRKLELILDAKSITTHNEDRDVVVASKDYFDVANFPEIRLSAKKIKTGKIQAEVTIRGKTKGVPFECRYLGAQRTTDGKEVVAVILMGTLNKKDFGFEYNITDENGQPLLGDDMQIMLRLVGIE